MSITSTDLSKKELTCTFARQVGVPSVEETGLLLKDKRSIAKFRISTKCSNKLPKEYRRAAQFW